MESDGRRNCWLGAAGEGLGRRGEDEAAIQSIAESQPLFSLQSTYNELRLSNLLKQQHLRQLQTLLLPSSAPAAPQSHAYTAQITVWT